MEYRSLGRTGLKVSVISLGGWVTYGGHVGNESAFECMKTAYDAGINFFDTAEGYAGGASEVVMGETIKKYGWPRCELVISTKINWGSANASSVAKAVNCVGLSRKHIIEGLKASLERLQLDYVDIVYAHRPDRDTPMEEIVRAFNHVIEKGQAFYWGTSEWTAEEIADAWRVADKLRLIGPAVEQPQYNLLTRQKVEKDYIPLFEKHGLGITCFSPLKIGVLTGKYNNFKIPDDSRLATATDSYTLSVRASFDSDEDMKKNITAARELKPIADKLGIKQSQLALAWVIKNPNLSSAIIGASKPEQILENIEALKYLDKLTPEIMAEIENVVKNKPVLEPRRFN
ncbi:hypothetical protein Q9L58_002588 [Maublancomyces gigas]|uniref:NADP-dependent oxidoreductase domain-containing protein n=1 Tax=Discina gigas TaxID=1032678 RepID=A0ABR3GRB5_9PEZI